MVKSRGARAAVKERPVTASASPDGPLVLVQENHDLPLVRLCLVLRGGMAEDPPGLEGLAQFASELARRGAAGMGREELDARFDALGADLGVSVTHDAVTYDLQVLSRHLEEALGLLAEVILRPDFRPEEAEHLMRETEAGLDELMEDDPSLARRFFFRELFGAHPYGKPALGTRSSIARFSAAASRDWMERMVSGGNLIVGVSGAVDARAVTELILRRFRALRPGALPHVALPMPAPARGLRALLVDKPERTQSQILIGQPVPAWSDPDFIPLSVATNAFGGTFTARLMTEVRAKRGLSYGASARLGQGRGPRSLLVYVFPSIERTGETLELVLELWRDWVENGLHDEELAFARENLASSFTCDLVTCDDRLDLFLSMALCGLPPDYMETTAARIRAVTPEQVRATMKRHLRARDLTVTVLSTAGALRDQLQGRKGLRSLFGRGDLPTYAYDSF
ncbi:MAG TPA: pitrilysin family protein [Polyangia bacterium]|nr:pitrilysin family protein [Polyangia bacterium]